MGVDVVLGWAIFEPGAAIRRYTVSCVRMKRLTRKRREHQLRRAAYEAKRCPHRAGTNTLAWRPLVRRVDIKFRGHVDLVDNPEETRAQLARLDSYTHAKSSSRQRLFIDLSEVTYLDPCALLHIAAQLDHARQRMFRVSGNYPKAEEPRRILRDARFERFMGSPERLGLAPNESPQLDLRRGDRSTGLRPRDWVPLSRFLKSHGNLNDEEADTVYNAFGECVENVHQHAYRGRSGSWYALAIRPTNRPARVVVLDLGVGIPRSIRRNLRDKIHQFVGKGMERLRAAFDAADRHSATDQPVDDIEEMEDARLEEFFLRLEAVDWMCVQLATQGKRTETGEAKRGKGLSELRKSTLERARGSFHVLSGRAAITWTHGVEPQPTNHTPLRGTAVVLELGAASRIEGDDDRA